MKSNKIKGLHEMLGKPIISYIISAAENMGDNSICIVGKHLHKDTRKAMANGADHVFLDIKDTEGITKFIGHSQDVMILSGDTPLITDLELKELAIHHRKTKDLITILSTDSDEGQAGICIMDSTILKSALLQYQDKDNDGIEYLVGEILHGPYKKAMMKINDITNLQRVDTRVDLAKCAQIMKDRINKWHMENGVTLQDPSNTYIEPDVTIGYDTVIEPNCMLKGQTQIGNNCFIGCHSNIINTQVADGVYIENSVIYESFIDESSHIGPFAYIRPQSTIGKNVRIGDFVEIKNATIGDNTKVSHLTYVGDADVGQHVNFGCGTILVNYDSVEKHRSNIEDYAFIGCNTNLVSPVNVGERAFVAAGSTITKDVPKESLGISRVRQENKEGWVAHKYPKR